MILFVEWNPVRAVMVTSEVEYPWSSGAAHASGLDRSGVPDMDWWRREWNEGDWQAVLETNADESAASRIRRATYTGRPLGDAGFVARLEQTLGRRLAPQPGGRPKREIPDRPAISSPVSSARGA